MGLKNQPGGKRESASSTRPRVLAFMVLALLAHAMALPVIVAWWRRLPAPRKVDMVALGDYSQAVNEARQQRHKAQSDQPRPKPAEAPAKKKPEEKLTGQVVDLPPSPDSRVPDKADYLSEHNTRTERETRSRHQSADYDNVMNEPTVANKAEVAAPQTPQASSALEIGPQKPKKAPAKPPQDSKAAMEIPTQKARDRLALRFDPTLGQFHNRGDADKIDGNSDKLRIAPGETGDTPSEDGGTAPKKGLTMADLIPQVGVLARLNGGPSNDALENVEQGEGTFLNSREFKYASFFNRLKRSVSQHWKPLAEYQRRDPTGNIYGYRARITVLSITLNPDGTLKLVEVKQSSGVDFLDREALAAFQRAEPFPNPPKALIDGSGHITFPFGFHIDFNSRGGGGFDSLPY